MHAFDINLFGNEFRCKLLNGFYLFLEFELRKFLAVNL